MSEPGIETIRYDDALLRGFLGILASEEREGFKIRQRRRISEGLVVYRAPQIIGEPYRGSLFDAPDLNRLTGEKVG